MIVIDKNVEFNNFPPYTETNFDPRMNDPMFNPMMQYEQGYMYYRYLTCQMEYKIRCKEYEKLCKNDDRATRRDIS